MLCPDSLLKLVVGVSYSVMKVLGFMPGGRRVSIRAFNLYNFSWLLSLLVREVLRTFNEADLEEGPPPDEGDTLSSMLLAHFNLKSPEDLFSVVYAPDSAPDVFVDNEGHLEKPKWAEHDRKQRIVSLCPLLSTMALRWADSLTHKQSIPCGFPA